MSIKVSEVNNVQQVDVKTPVQKADDSFKFMLVSNIEEKELKNKLSSLMEDITSQGERIAKHMDVADMKKYRSLIKEFMNEVVTH